MQQSSDNIRTTYNYRGFPMHDGVEVASDSGKPFEFVPPPYEKEPTPYEMVPSPEVPQSSGWSFAALVPAFLTRAKAEADAEGGSSARITGRAGYQMSSYGGQKSVCSEQPHSKSPEDADGGYSPYLDDLEASVSEYEGRLRKEIERLEDRNKDLEKHYVAKAKEYHLEKIHVEDLQRELQQQQARADALEKDIKKIRDGRYQQKARADALEIEIRTYISECEKFREGFHQEKARADAWEVEISKFKSELAGLRQVKARADAYEKEISKYKSELAGFQQQATVHGDAFDKEISKYKSELAGLRQVKARADAYEKEISKYKSELAGLDRESTRAAATLVKEKKENLEGLSVQKERADKLETEKRELEGELQGLQSKLQNHANALAVRSEEYHFEKSRVEYLLRELHQQQELASIHKETSVNELEGSPSHTPENVVDASTLMNSPSPASANFFSLDAPISRAVSREESLPSTSKVQRVSLAQSLTKRLRSLFPSHSAEGAPKADAVIKRCRQTIQSSAEFWNSASSDQFLNRHQCDFLVRGVTAADSTLASIQQFPLFSKSTIPVLQELHLYLLDADRLMRRSYINGTNYEWLGATVEQGDFKYTFSHLLYSIQWCTSLLQYILLENSNESHVQFSPNLCDCQLRASDELELLTTRKEDEEELKVRLRAIVKELDVSKLEGNFASKLLAKLEAYSPDLVLMNPNDLDLDGHEIGRGAFGVVRKSNFLDLECVVKTLEHFSPTLIEKEMEAIQKLGNHPHIVRHFCFSKTDLEDEVYFVMELLEMDLERALRGRRNQPLSLVEAVSLMLQIGEGMKYMHGKGVAHRDLKPGNVLINFEKVEGCSRIRSVKIADFGSAKAAEETETNTMNTGTTKYMAPEVMKAKGDPEKTRLNLLNADVYSFAMMCIHILTGKYPYKYNNQEIRERSKAGERPLLRYDLPNCPLRLATVLTRCWSQIPHERPSFYEICIELRYIKGLLLKGDEQKLQTQLPGPGPQTQIMSPSPQNPLERVKLEGS